MEIVNRMILPSIQLLLNRAKVHWFLDDLEIVGQPQFNGVDWGIENPTMLVRLQSLENFRAFFFELLRRQLGFPLECLEMGLELLNREAFEKGMIA